MSFGAFDESIDIQFGITNLNRTDNADTTFFAHGRSHHAHDIAALIGGRLIGGDIGEAEGIGGGSPGKGCVGKIRGDFLEGTAVLGAVGDDQIKPFFGIIANGCGGVFNHKGAVGNGQFDGAFFLDGLDTVDNTLGKGQVIPGAGRNNGNAQGLAGGQYRRGRQQEEGRQNGRQVEITSFHCWVSSL